MNTFKILLFLIIVTGCCVCQTAVAEMFDKKTDLLAQTNYQKKNTCNYNETRSQPDWINKDPSDSTYYYGVGMAEYRDSLDSQMRTAEIKARNALAVRIAVICKYDYQDKYKEDNTGSTQEVTSLSDQRAHAIMKGAEIIDRWKDSANCLVYVLARIRKDSGKSLLEK
ncbi:MAG: LPP20 family lipoprotein [Candidatus Magnetomorum sp.]|nr:LPP20 family lipoprotein [Candidatus Magnetomorum sp.]